MRVNPVPRTYVRGFRACPSGTSEHSPREIAARGAFKVMTEEIISRGSSPRLRTGRSVVRGKVKAPIGADEIKSTPLALGAGVS